MATLVRCNHTIMSTGTFSWWTAYLTNGTTIYYSDWPRHNSVMEKMMNKNDYFLNSWVPMWSHLSHSISLWLLKMKLNKGIWWPHMKKKIWKLSKEKCIFWFENCSVPQCSPLLSIYPNYSEIQPASGFNEN